MFWDYFNARRRNKHFTSAATFNCRCGCGRLKDRPTEAYVKLLFTLVGTAMEVGYGLKDYMFFGGFQNNVQHATMYSVISVNAVIDILCHYKAPVPPDSDYVSMAIAVVSQGLLYASHLHGRKGLDVLVHTLLVYLSITLAAVILIEMKYRNNIMAALSRAYLTLVVGTWYWQEGWMLYPPFPWSFQWDPNDHGQMMIATTVFVWHLIVDFLIMLGIGGIVARVHRRYYSSGSTDSYYSSGSADSVYTSLPNCENNGEACVRLVDDQSDLETESNKPVVGVIFR